MAKEHSNDSQKTPEEIKDRLWELAEKIRICMFTTWDGERQRSRPLSARVMRDEHAIYFLVDVEGEKNAQIAQFPMASCAWVDSGGHKYALMSGPARLSNDRDKIRSLWSDFDKAWWDDENDPTIRLMSLTPEDGELWDSPNRAVAFTKMTIAMMTGAAPKMGDNAEVQL
jgi:general stress protein 26